MLFQSLLTAFAFFILTQSSYVPLPDGTCTVQPGSDTLFCDGAFSIPNRYVIKFKPDATSSEILAHLKSTNSTLKTSDCSLGASAASVGVALSSPGERNDAVAQCHDANCEFKKHYWKETEAGDTGKCGFNYIYDSVVGGSKFQGYAVAMAADALAKVLADPIVEMVSTDKLVKSNAFAVPNPICAQRTSAQPNLVRVSTPEEHVSQAPSSRNTVYKFDASAGYNQNYYVIDSGVRKDHANLPTVQWAGNFVNNAEVDDFGHGTHVAGIIRSNPYGVMPYGTVVAIKVLDNTGTGTTSNLLAGIQRAHDHFFSGTNNPGGRTYANGFSGVINFSIGYSGREPLVENALQAVSQAGITVVVAGGNGNTDACSVTPAAGPGVIAVGNLDINDNRSPSSNFGDCIDIWAPGTNIVSTSAFGTNTATVVMTGTSMACPHVAGIIAGMKTRMSFSNTLNYLFVRSQLLSLAHWVTPVGFPNTEKRPLLYNGKGTCTIGGPA